MNQTCVSIAKLLNSSNHNLVLNMTWFNCLYASIPWFQLRSAMSSAKHTRCSLVFEGVEFIICGVPEVRAMYWTLCCSRRYFLFSQFILSIKQQYSVAQVAAEKHYSLLELILLLGFFSTSYPYLAVIQVWTFFFLWLHCFFILLYLLKFMIIDGESSR